MFAAGGGQRRRVEEATHSVALLTPQGAVVKSTPIQGAGYQLGQRGALLAVRPGANYLTSWFLENLTCLLLNVLFSLTMMNGHTALTAESWTLGRSILMGSGCSVSS